MEVVIVGAGVVGLTSALYLAGAGHRVTVVDSAPDSVHGTSVHNAGWVVPAMADPVPAPGMVRTGLRMMLSRTSPLYIRPTLDPAKLRDVLGLVRNCTAERFERGVAALGTLAAGSLAGLADLAKYGIEFDGAANDGLVLTGRTRDKVEHLYADQQRHHPESEAVLLGPAELRDLEPALVGDFAGGVLCAAQRCIDPAVLVDGLVTACRAAGVRLAYGNAVVGHERRGREWHRARLDDGSAVHGGWLVLAAGIGSRSAARTLGVYLPVFAGKGYGIDLPATRLPLTRATYLTDDKVAVSPTGSRVRLSGTMEIGGDPESLSVPRLGGIRDAGRRAFGARVEGEPLRAFAGNRPLTPDGLPALGLLPGFDNVVVATGHQMLGVTLAAPTAAAVTAIVGSGTVPAELAPLSPGRFSRAGSRAHWR